jgi:DNA-binding response OmpR family regulator
VIRRCLVRLGHTVLLAEDGDRALRVAAAHPHAIDLLITDVVMPNLGGAEMARQLTRQRPELRVLFISGYSWGESLPASDLEAGVGYLQKPFDTRALEARVGELLARHRSACGERPPDGDLSGNQGQENCSMYLPIPIPPDQ